MLTTILFAIAIILLGAVAPKPIGYIAIGLAVLVLLLSLVGPVRIGAIDAPETPVLS